MRRSAGTAGAVGLSFSVLTAVLVTGIGAPVAAEGELTLTLSSSTGLRDGEVITYEVSGIPEVPDTVTEVRQCFDPVSAGASIEEIDRSCTLADYTVGGAPAVGGTITLREVYEPTPGAEVDYCSDEPSDCSIVAFTRPEPGKPVGPLAVVPIDMAPSPLLVTGVGLTDPARSVVVRVTGEPGASLRLAQCVRYADVPRGWDDCLAGPEMVLPETGRATAEMVVAATQDVSGQTIDCVRRPCEVTLFDQALTVVAAVGIPGSPPSAELTLDRSTDLASGSVVHARVESRVGGQYLGLCVASVLDGTVTPPQGCSVLAGPVPPGTSEHDIYVFDQVIPVAPGSSTLRCADDPGGCIVALGQGTGGVSAYVPLSFAGPASLSLSPATGLLDGQRMNVDITGLAPGEEYLLQRCYLEISGWLGCGSVSGAPPFVASAEGTAEVTVAAAQRFLDGSGYYCRDRCSIGVTLASQWGPVAYAGYSMAEGSITASPASDLVDRQTIRVSGTDLMSTYRGQSTWFGRVGTWSLVQCDRAVQDDQSLHGVFTHCAFPPPGGAVDIPGSTFSLRTQVRARIDKILGGTTNCTAAPGSCVFALARFEQDGSTSLHTTPLTFAASP